MKFNKWKFVLKAHVFSKSGLIKRDMGIMWVVPLMVAVDGCGGWACDSSAERCREGGARRGDSASPATLSATPATYWPSDVRKLMAALNHTDLPNTHLNLCTIITQSMDRNTHFLQVTSRRTHIYCHVLKFHRVTHREGVGTSSGEYTPPGTNKQINRKLNNSNRRNAHVRYTK